MQRPTPSNDNAHSGLTRGIYSAADLEHATIATPRSVVPGIVVVGLNMLASKSKLGKSWWALGVGLAVASGGKALGAIDVRQSDVLYLALEDNQRRMQDRIDLLLGTPGWPARLHIAHEWPKLDDGGLEKLDGWLYAHSEAGLVIVDVWKRVRHKRGRGANLYDEDYEHLVGLQALTQKYGVAILVIHHTRKAAAEDVFDEINASTGVMAALDTCVILHRSRSEADAEIWVTGRDVEESHLALKFDAGHWSLLGSAAEVTKSRQRHQVLATVRAAGGALTPGAIALTLGLPANRVRQTLYQMRAAGEITRLSNSKYVVRLTPNEGNGANSPNGVMGAEEASAVAALGVRSLRTGDDDPARCPNCGATDYEPFGDRRRCLRPGCERVWAK